MSLNKPPRYELDLVIELNSSTMRALEPILKQIIDLPDDEASRFKIDNLDGIFCNLIVEYSGPERLHVIPFSFAHSKH